MSEHPEIDEFEFSPHALRLGGREWLAVVGIVVIFAALAPRLWMRVERIEVADDYRIPYALSDDYWLYERHLREAAADEAAIFVIGDSVVWGEYVTRDGTLSHFLSAESGGRRRFVNAGVNGLFPLALEGLIGDVARVVQDREVVLHANLLWMSSPEADLSIAKERKFNHEGLVPQFSVGIPCYRASLDRRLGYLAERNIAQFSWSKHLQICYFDQLGIPDWTLEAGNAYKNPLAAINREIPGEPADDPERGLASPRHQAWSLGGREPQSFDWVAPEESLQLAAFKRLVELLRSRGNNLLVVLGPFNEHMIAEGNRQAFGLLKGELEDWLAARGIPHFSPEVLPSEQFGDASHPLTGGYRLLAEQIWQASEAEGWLAR